MQNRRNFLRTALMGSLAVSSASSFPSHAGDLSMQRKPRIHLPKGAVVLFQGDSITDAGRLRNIPVANHNEALGSGYAFLATSELLCRFADSDLKIFNRGISGNKVFQLAGRWQDDCLNLKPHLLSIMIGVNDFWHKLEGKYDGTPEVYERDYRALLQRTLQALPGVQLVLCEPYAIRNTTAVNEKWFPEFDLYREISLKLANEFDALYVPFQKIFNQAEKKAPGAYWSPDGVHPSLPGARLMADAWMNCVFGG